MNKIHILILHFLINNNDGPITAATLASEFSVSARTIKSYIKLINESDSDTIIYSSNRGYTVNRANALKLIQKQKVLVDNIPQNYQERIQYTLKRLVIENDIINLHDLTEEIYTSYSTLRADISTFNDSHRNKDIEISIKKDEVSIRGNENNIRRLLSKIIFDEIPNKLMTKEILLKNFPEDYVNDVFSVLTPLLKENSIRINEFAFMNLILHILVIIISTKHERENTPRNGLFICDNKLLTDMSNETSDKLNETFDIILSDVDRNQITLLFHSNINFIPNNRSKTLENKISSKIFDAYREVITSIKKYYDIDLDSAQFEFNFLIHLSNLYVRAKSQSIIKNPMKSLLKRNFPIVYDIAVFSSVQLSKKLDIDIIDDEVAYLALHIGNEIENQKENIKKIKTILICPNYMNMAEKLYLDINSNFTDLNITSLALDINQILQYDVELIITTVMIEDNIISRIPNTKIVKIAPFLDSSQKTLISNAIESVNVSKKRSILLNHFDTYFDPKYFTKTNDYKTRDEVLKYMCDTLYKNKVVKENFYEQVINRDNASSTAFGQISIPHSLFMDAHDTKVNVLISTDGINWGDKIVHVVFLAAINFNDRSYYPEVYEAIISLFDSDEGLRNIISTNDFNTFNKYIINNAF